MLNEDTLANRIIKSTLAILIKHEKLNSTIRDEARSLYRKLPGISTLHLTPQHFSYLNGGKIRVIINSLSVSANSSSIILFGSKQRTLPFLWFWKKRKEMSLLYQKFLYEFCRRELTSANTTRSYLKWDASSISDQSLNLLPRMETDITIRSSEKYLSLTPNTIRAFFTTNGNRKISFAKSLSTDELLMVVKAWKWRKHRGY